MTGLASKTICDLFLCKTNEILPLKPQLTALKKDKKLFENTIAHIEYLLESLKQLSGDMVELEYKKTTLNEFAPIFSFSILTTR